jgi:diacylglycerol kinase family enzyme
MTTYLPPEADGVLILVNPKAGRRSSLARADRLADALRTRGLDVQVMDDLAAVADRANQLQEQGRLRALVGVGGDGTAAELANRTLPGTPLTLLAAGTANLLARHFRLPNSPERLAAMISTGFCRRMDAGRAAQRIFLLMASCGFDAEVVRQVHDLRHSRPGRGHISYASYLKPIWGSIRNYQYPEIRVYCDEPAGGASPHPEVQPCIARWAFVFNLSRYGWGLSLVPQADYTDGLLDVCTFRRGFLWHGLRYLAGVQLGGWHRRWSDCGIRQARRIRITSDQPVAYQLDGDPAGWLPLEIEVLPGRLSLIVPAVREER